MNEIIVIGSANTDLVVKSKRIPAVGETIIGESFKMAFGGKGANQAIAAKRLGGEVSFMCCLGDDIYGKEQYTALKKEGFNTDLIYTIEDVNSGIAIIMVDKNAENCISVAPGANNFLSPALIESSNLFNNEVSYILLQLEIPIETIKYITKESKKSGAKVILNAAPAVILPDEILSDVNILIVNETEAEILAENKIENWKNVISLGEHLLSKVMDSVIITMGRSGVFVFSKNKERLQIPAYSVQAVDTTGAGDTFCGALTCFLNKGISMEEAVMMANAAAAICVTKMGAQDSIPYKKELFEFLQKENLKVEAAEY